MDKKGVSEEGTGFNLNRLSVLIIFLVAIAVGIILLVPKLTTEAFGKTTGNFGKYIWDILTGGR